MQKTMNNKNYRITRRDEASWPHRLLSWMLLHVIVPSLVIFSCLLGVMTHVFAAPPRMPSAFDAATVKHLIDTIDQGQNAVVLKFGYFEPRSVQALPIEAGLELVTNALDKETLGSKRWYLLESVSGFAGIHSNPTSHRGYQAYRNIFDRASDAQKAGEADTVLEAVDEYVFTIAGEYGPAQSHEYAEAKEVLLKALVAYFVLIGRSTLPPHTPDWTRAIQATGSYDDFSTLVDKMLRGPKSKTYAVLRTAASVYEAHEQRKAMGLLLSAKEHLPENNTAEFQQCYSDLIHLEASNGDIADAIKDQQEVIKKTGQGIAGLAILYRLGKDNKSFTRIFNSLMMPGANEAEINALAVLLIKLHYQDRVLSRQAYDQAKELLSGYLSAKRVRNSQEQLFAQHLLADLKR